VGLVLPTGDPAPAPGWVEYGFGEWEWYALGNDAWYRVFPAMRSAYPSEWLGALTRAEKMDVAIYIAGHGFTEQGPVSREELRTYHKALEADPAEAGARDGATAVNLGTGVGYSVLAVVDAARRTL